MVSIGLWFPYYRRAPPRDARGRKYCTMSWPGTPWIQIMSPCIS